MAVSFIGGGNRSTTIDERGFELTTLVMIGTDCIGSYTSTTILSQPRRPLKYYEKYINCLIRHTLNPFFLPMKTKNINLFEDIFYFLVFQKQCTKRKQPFLKQIRMIISLKINENEFFIKQRKYEKINGNMSTLRMKLGHDS